jgi:Zn-dependent protease
LTPDQIGQFAVVYVVFLFSLTLHEAAHALLAWWGGDDTAYRGGQVTLNPIPHLRREPFGTVLMPVLSFFMAGWMMGWASTPYDPSWGERHPRRQALMSAAGPAANLLFAGVALVVTRLLVKAGTLAAPDSFSFTHLVAPPPGTADASVLVPLAVFLSVAVNLNVLLGLFNLIPLPPLDGAGILEGLLPGPAGRMYALLRANAMLSLLGLLAAWKVFGFIAQPAFAVVFSLVHPDLYLY